MPGQVLKPILQAYFLLEEHYYELLDALEEQFSIPVYDYFVDPVESKGIPSFFIALLLFFLVVAGSLLVLTAQTPPGVQVLVLGKLSPTHSIPLEGATVQILDESGVLVTKKTVHGVARFENIPLKRLEAEAQKSGFLPLNQSFDPLGQNAFVRLELVCQYPSQCAAAYLESGLNPSDVPYSPNNSSGSNENNAGQSIGRESAGNLTESFSDLQPDSPTGRLLILVTDQNGTAIDGAQATVYDASSHGVIQFVNVVKGSALVPNLDVGKQVYVDVLADGFSTYFGNGSVVTIRPATNKVVVSMAVGNSFFVGAGNAACDVDFSSCTAANSARVQVVSDNGSALSYARVSIFAFDPNAPHPEVLYSDYTNDQGYMVLSVGNGSYFASADLAGYISNYSEPFSVNQSAKIVLTFIKNPDQNDCLPKDNPLCGLGTNEARVWAHVRDDSGKNASFADLVLQQKTDFGAWFVKDQTTASNNGDGLFSALAPGAQVNALASLDDENGNASAALVQGINPLAVQLAKKAFLVRAFAYDPLGRQFVSDAAFASYFGSKLVGQCQGNGCSLQMLSGQDVLVNVSSPGYLGSQESFNLYDGVDSNLTMFIVSSDALKDTFVQWQGLFDEQDHPVVGPLKPGHSYLARLQVFSKNADQTGVVLDTQNDDATITGLDPQGFDMQGSNAGSCSTASINFAQSSDAWLDARYSSAFSGLVTFNVTLNPDMALDPATKTKTLSLAYRSYLVRGPNYLRNPYDPSLSTNADPTHASGCPALSYAQNFTVKSTGTTCNGQACVSLLFLQGGQQGTDGFAAQNQVLVQGTKLDPLYIDYAVELYAPIHQATIFAFQAPSNRLIVLNASTPFTGRTSGLNNGKICDLKKGVSFNVLNSSFSLNLTGLTQCTNYGNPMRLDGVATARALEAGSSNVSVSLNGVGSPLNQTEVLNVDGFGVAANDFGIVEAQMGQTFNQNVDHEPFLALSTGNCTASLIQNGQCDVGFVNATFRITALSGNAISTKVSNDGPLQLVDVSPAFSVPVVNRGDSFQGVARFLVPAAHGSTTVTLSRDWAGQSTVLNRTIGVGGAPIFFNSSEPFPSGWDTCNGYVGIRYDPTLNPSFSLGQGCTDLGFKISTIFPADAIPLNVSIPDYGQVLTKVSQTDGSDTCYEICETDKTGSIYGCDLIGKTLTSGTNYLLRYNPELRPSCPAKFKVNGNSIASSQITLQFGFSGEQVVSRNVTLHVLADESDPDLYISPIVTFLRSGVSGLSPLYPQLWAVTNLKQLGPRTVLFKQPANKAIQFSGPGTQVVALVPGAVKGVLAFDGSDLNTPVFEYGNASSPIQPISRYGQAAAALSYQLDLDSPYAQALQQLLAQTQSAESFLSKSVSDALSDSVPALANRTAYWRSDTSFKYCQQSQACVQSGYTLAHCCRESLDAWQNVTVTAQYARQSCVFCNNTFNPNCDDASIAHIQKYLQCSNKAGASSYACDQRCTSKALFPADFQSRFDQAVFPGSGVTVDVLAGNKLHYGDTLGGKTCQMDFSSLNAFVELAPQSYSYYNPSFPLNKITDSAMSHCQSNGQCPLVFQAASTALGSFSATPQCVLDSDGDGLWQPSEPLTPAIQTTVQQWDAYARSYSSSIEFDCSPGQIIAVSEALFFQPALKNGGITVRNLTTAADIARCKKGLCPLVMNPLSSLDDPGAPLCFTDVVGKGFLDESISAELNSLTPANVVVGLGGTGIYYSCPYGQLAVSNTCLSSCENFCSQPNCDPDPACLPSGTKNIATGQTIRTVNGWLNESPVIAVRLSSNYLSYGQAFIPAALFSDAYEGTTNGKPIFMDSYVVNSKAQPGVLGSLSGLVSSQGCNPSADFPYSSTAFPEQGVFEIKDSNQADVAHDAWTSSATVVDLPLSSYVGSRSDICRKPSWDTKLCELTFVDSSSQFGACFNSILQYSGADKMPGVNLPLIGGLGYGVKNGIGFGVSPSGHVFAQTDPGTSDETCGSGNGEDPKHKYHRDYQTLHHWYPDGQKQDQMDFKWTTDLGCSKDCGCKKKGYGLFDFIVQLFGFGSDDSSSSYSGIFFTTVGNIAGIPIDALRSSIINVLGAPMAGSSCKSWSFGDTVAYACKASLWQISGT